MNTKSSIISVRVDSEIKKDLEAESEINSVTLNTLISQILTKHSHWDKFAEDIGFVSSTRAFMRSVLESVSEKDITIIAKTTCKSAFKDAIIYTHGEITTSTILKTIDLWLSSSHIAFRHITKNNVDRIIIQHELGKKWTTYFSAMITSIFEDIEIKPGKMIKTEQSISFELE